MIDIRNETLIPANAVCHKFPGPTGHGISRATLHRLMRRGTRGVVLESLKISGTRYTSHEAIARFVAALNGGVPAPKPADHAREAKRVDAILAAEGF